MRVAFAGWLEARLEQSGTKGAKLAEKLGVQPPTVARWLSGETRPRVEMLASLAAELGEDVNVLYRLAGYPPLATDVPALTGEGPDFLFYFRRLSPEQRRVALAVARGGQNA